MKFLGVVRNHAGREFSVLMHEPGTVCSGSFDRHDGRGFVEQTNDAPIVEFRDRTYAGRDDYPDWIEYGQPCGAQYNLETLRDFNAEILDLYGGEPVWEIDYRNVREAVRMADDAITKAEIQAEYGQTMDLDGLAPIGKFYRVGVRVMYEGSDEWTGKIRRIWAKNLTVRPMKLPDVTITVLAFDVVNSDGGPINTIEIVQAELVEYVYRAAESLKYGGLQVVRNGRSSVHATEIEEALKS